MAKRHHIRAVLTKEDVAAFLRGLGGKHEDVARTARVPHPTLIKWYQTKPPDMGAAGFLRVVIALRAEATLADWLRDFGRQSDLLSKPEGLQLDATKATASVGHTRTKNANKK